MFILKQLLFSISVNSGFRNIFNYIFRRFRGLVNIFIHYSPQFQRIIVKYLCGFVCSDVCCRGQ